MDKVFMELAEGNPGALTFLMESALNIECAAYMPGALARAYDLDINGAKLYMLWNDCCARNHKAALALLRVESKKSLMKHINFDEGRGTPYTTEEMEAAIREGV